MTYEIPDELKWDVYIGAHSRTARRIATFTTCHPNICRVTVAAWGSIKINSHLNKKLHGFAQTF